MNPVRKTLLGVAMVSSSFGGGCRRRLPVRWRERQRRNDDDHAIHVERQHDHSRGSAGRAERHVSLEREPCSRGGRERGPRGAGERRAVPDCPLS